MESVRGRDKSTPLREFARQYQRRIREFKLIIRIAGLPKTTVFYVSGGQRFLFAWPWVNDDVYRDCSHLNLTNVTVDLGDPKLLTIDENNAII